MDTFLKMYPIEETMSLSTGENGVDSFKDD